MGPLDNVPTLDLPYKRCSNGRTTMYLSEKSEHSVPSLALSTCFSVVFFQGIVIQFIVRSLQLLVP